MIYMVEAALTERQTAEDWDRWYHSMKPPHVLATQVPGISTTQRFKGINVVPPAYLAIYSVTSADVMTSAAYRNVGGGRFRTDDWRPFITFWNRDLFDGMDAPDVPLDAMLLLLDRPHAGDAPLGLSFRWLPSVGLDRSTPWRGLAVLSAAAAADLPLGSIAGLRTFRPVIPQVTRERPLPSA